MDLLRTRMFGSKVYVDLEIEVDGNMLLLDSHAVAERFHNLEMCIRDSQSAHH